MKTCTCCGSEKPMESFYKKADSKDGRASACIQCRKLQKAAEYQASRERILAKSAAYRLANPEKAALAKKIAYTKKCDEYVKKSSEKYAANKESILVQMAEYRRANPELIKERHRAYNLKNREAKVAKQKVYYLENKEKVTEYQRRYARERSKSDPLYALSKLVRRRICIALKDFGSKKRSRTAEMLGCSYAELRVHLEKQFQPGMSWQNRGKWHIDHQKPLASATTEYELLALCHYTNLQPLWAFDNLSKGARLIPSKVA